VLSQKLEPKKTTTGIRMMTNDKQTQRKDRKKRRRREEYEIMTNNRRKAKGAAPFAPCDGRKRQQKKTQKTDFGRIRKNKN